SPSTVFQTSTSLTHESTVLVMSRKAGLPAVPRLGARKRRASIPTCEMRPSHAYLCSDAPGGVTYLPSSESGMGTSMVTLLPRMGGVVGSHACTHPGGGPRPSPPL